MAVTKVHGCGSPEADRLILDRAKTRDYLLSRTHPIGRFKASFFRFLGYSDVAPDRLEEDIRELVGKAEAIPRERTAYGRKYEVRGSLEGPSGRQAEVVTIWIVLNGEDLPRLVTAYPGAGE